MVDSDINNLIELYKLEHPEVDLEEEGLKDISLPILTSLLSGHPFLGLAATMWKGQDAPIKYPQIPGLEQLKTGLKGTQAGSVVEGLETTGKFLAPKTYEDIPKYMSYGVGVPASLLYGVADTLSDVSSGEEKNLAKRAAIEFGTRVVLPYAFQRGIGFLGRVLGKNPPKAQPIKPGEFPVENIKKEIEESGIDLTKKTMSSLKGFARSLPGVSKKLGTKGIHKEARILQTLGIRGFKRHLPWLKNIKASDVVDDTGDTLSETVGHLVDIYKYPKLSDKVRDKLFEKGVQHLTDKVMGKYPQRVLKTMTLKDIGMLSRVSSPERVLELVPGVGKKINNSTYLYLKYVAYADDVVDQAIKGKSQASLVKMSLVQDGRLPMSALTPDEQLGVEQVQKIMGEGAKLLKLDPQQRLHNYFSHIYPNAERAYSKGYLPPEILDTLPKDIGLYALKQRTGRTGYSLDFAYVNKFYLRSMAKKAMLEPAVMEAKNVEHLLPKNYADYLNSYLRYVIKGQPTRQEDLVRTSLENIPMLGPKLTKTLGNKPATKLSSMLNEMIYFHTIGGRPKQFAVNLTQNSNYLALIPTKDSRFILEGMRQLGSEAGRKLVRQSGVVDTSLSAQELNILTGPLEKVQDTAFLNMRLSEWVSRSLIYLSERTRQISLGKSVHKAEKLAYDMTMKVHFRYKYNMPWFQWFPAGKASGALTSYVLKQTELEVGLAKEGLKQLAQRQMPVSLGSLAKMKLLQFGMNQGFKAIGINTSKELGAGLMTNSIVPITLPNGKIVNFEAEDLPLGAMPMGAPTLNMFKGLVDNTGKAVWGTGLEKQKAKAWLSNIKTNPLVPLGRALGPIIEGQQAMGVAYRLNPKATEELSKKMSKLGLMEKDQKITGIYLNQKGDIKFISTSFYEDALKMLGFTPVSQGAQDQLFTLATQMDTSYYELMEQADSFLNKARRTKTTHERELLQKEFDAWVKQVATRYDVEEKALTEALHKHFKAISRDKGKIPQEKIFSRVKVLFRKSFLKKAIQFKLIRPTKKKTNENTK